MDPLINAVKVGFKSLSDGPGGEHFTVADQPVTCPHCAHDRFIEGHAQLNTAGLTFLELDWANRSAATLACAKCGHLMWFLKDPVGAD